MEAGKLELASAPLDLRDVVEEAAGVVAQRAAEKGLRLAVHVDPALDTAAVGDPERLRQVLLNLLSNAVKFTAAGGVSVAVSDGGPAAGGRRAFRVEVRDTGIGISAEGQRKLFGRFSQVRRARAAAPGERKERERGKRKRERRERERDRREQGGWNRKPDKPRLWGMGDGTGVYCGGGALDAAAPPGFELWGAARWCAGRRPASDAARRGRWTRARPAGERVTQRQ